MKEMSLPLLIFAYVCAGVGCVVEERESYSCCGSRPPALPFDPRCDHVWTIDAEPFAGFERIPEGCQTPCKTLLPGSITLDRCVEVNVTIVCHNELGAAEEKRIFFYGETCTDANHIKAAAPNKTETAHQRERYVLLIPLGCLLLVLVIVGIVRCVGRARHTAVHKNLPV